MKIYGYILFSILLVSCASTNKRGIASDQKSRKDIEQSIFHDLRMAESHLATAKINGYRTYLSSLNEVQLEQLQQEIKDIRLRSKDLHQAVTDWISTLSHAEMKEIRGK